MSGPAPGAAGVRRRWPSRFSDADRRGKQIIRYRAPDRTVGRRRESFQGKAIATPGTVTIDRRAANV
jgi:hypothetical protein